MRPTGLQLAARMGRRPILIRNDDVDVYRGVNEEAALSREHGYPTHIGTSPRYHSQ